MRHWLVTLTGGVVVDVWAESLQGLEFSGDGPVARFPAGAVEQVVLAPDDTPHDTPADDRDARVRALVTRVLSYDDFEGRDALVAQVASVRVTGGPVTMLALQSAGAAAAVADGTLPCNAEVVDAAGTGIGMLMLWVAGGFLRGLEMPWWTDAPPAELPDPADLRPWRPLTYGP